MDKNQGQVDVKPLYCNSVIANENSKSIPQHSISPRKSYSTNIFLGLINKWMWSSTSLSDFRYTDIELKMMCQIERWIEVTFFCFAKFDPQQRSGCNGLFFRAFQSPPPPSNWVLRKSSSLMVKILNLFLISVYAPAVNTSSVSRI